MVIAESEITLAISDGQMAEVGFIVDDDNHTEKSFGMQLTEHSAHKIPKW